MRKVSYIRFDTHSGVPETFDVSACWGLALVTVSFAQYGVQKRVRKSLRGPMLLH